MLIAPTCDNAASCVSANNAEITPGCNDALEPSNKDDPPILKDVYVSRCIWRCGVVVITWRRGYHCCTTSFN